MRSFPSGRIALGGEQSGTAVHRGLHQIANGYGYAFCQAGPGLILEAHKSDAALAAGGHKITEDRPFAHALNFGVQGKNIQPVGPQLRDQMGHEPSLGIFGAAQ